MYCCFRISIPFSIIRFMKSIVEYTDYRTYILDYYKERKLLYGFTWRAFAEAASFKNPVYLKQICDGKYNLSAEAVERVATAMGLVCNDRIYFRSLVKFCQGKTERERLAAFECMRNLARSQRGLSLTNEAMIYFSSWKCSVVRELAAIMPRANAAEMSKVCIPKISVAEIQKTLTILENMNLLVRRNGAYRQTSKVVSMVDGFVGKFSAKRIQREMAEFGVWALENLPPEKRMLTGLTMGVSSKTYERVVYELLEFRKKIVSIVADDSPAEKVCRLNLQLFPLTREKNER